MNQKTYSKEGHKGNFLINLPKRGQIRETEIEARRIKSKITKGAYT